MRNLNNNFFVGSFVKPKIKYSLFGLNWSKVSLYSSYTDNDYSLKPKLSSDKGKYGYLVIRCTKNNIFCSVHNCDTRKTETSSSLRVPPHKSEFNEKENVYTRGLILGKVFGNKLISLGYTHLVIFVKGFSKARAGVLESLYEFHEARDFTLIDVIVMTNDPHNGCRPRKPPRKKSRVRAKKEKEE